MFKLTIVLFAVIACAAAKPGIVAPFAYSAPLIAPGVVTATSNQVIARNYNGIAAAPVLASAPLAAAPLAVAAPLRYAAAYNYAAAHLAAPYAAPLGYAGPLGYASPLSYAAPAPLLI